MGKKTNGKARIPKKVLGFKLSKGSRKDLRKLLKFVEGPEGRGVAISAASIAFGYFAEMTAGPASRSTGEPAVPVQAN